VSHSTLDRWVLGCLIVFTGDIARERTDGPTMTSNDAPGAYASVNGLQMYYEVHGSRGSAARPLVLMHGGLLTIDSFGPLIPALAKDREVIALEFQGHGHTADIDRELSLANFSTDVVGLLDHLGVERADLFGFSVGGLTGLQTAIASPDRVGRLIAASAHFRPDGYYDEIFDQSAWATSKRLPTQADFEEMRRGYVRVAPHPEQFDAFQAKLGGMVAAFPGWSDEALRGIAAPTLVVIGDTDFVRVEHAAEMRDLIPDAQLAVLPGTTHVGVLQRVDLVLPMIERFLS
jgi:pimeloyl-ACP methyl ester carboxylesterase